MNSELKKIESVLKIELKQLQKSYEEISDSLVLDASTDAYSYDSIIKCFYDEETRSRASSCDALLLKENLYFIEFKRAGDGIDMFNLDFTSLSETKFKKMLRILCSVEFKLSESLYTLEKWFLRPLAVDESQFEKHAIVVYDSKTNPSQALACSRASASGQQKTSQSHERFKSKDRDTRPVFFHDVVEIPDNLFTARVRSLT